MSLEPRYQTVSTYLTFELPYKFASRSRRRIDQGPVCTPLTSDLLCGALNGQLTSLPENPRRKIHRIRRVMNGSLGMINTEPAFRSAHSLGATASSLGLCLFLQILL
jgi:hypothetical protein